MDTKLRNRINWVGYIDWTVRDFHSYTTERGSTYNSYLIRDEKTALIDTVKAPHIDNLIANITEHTDPAKIDYLVCNHAEPDHSGSLSAMVAAMPNATVVCDEKCKAVLAAYYDTANWKFHTVASGDTISLGSRTLQFIETPMVHWPESMFTYVPEEKLLFSMDAFGQHYASSGRFDDQVPLCTIMEEAKTYYANIVMPYSKQVAKLLEQAKGLEIEIIAPSHGIIWRSNLDDILAAYNNWANNRPLPKVVVFYDTMWQSTAQMAQAILAGASCDGVEAELISIRDSNLTRIATAVLDSAAVAVGSATLNQNMMPMVGATLTFLKGLRPTGKAALAFGSYGWGRGGAETVQEQLEAMKWQTIAEPIRSRYRPTPEILEQCRQAGRQLAQKAAEISERPAGGRICVNQ